MLVVDVKKYWGFSFARTAAIFTMAAASAPSLFYSAQAEKLGLVPVAMTSVFAVYTLTLLMSLLFLGSLSDWWGRRPVITIGASLLMLSLVLFWLAPTFPILIAARALQGVSAGIIVPTLSAMMVDFQPRSTYDKASLWNTIGPMIGLGAGALGASILVDLTKAADTVVFTLLAAVFALISTLVWSVPESVGQTLTAAKPRWQPRFGLPRKLGRSFISAVPAIVAGWATNGLFLALGASIVSQELGGQNHTQIGILISVFAAAGIVASLLLYQSTARRISLYATSALGIGTALSVTALAAHSLIGYTFAAAVMGTGFGTAFLGALRSLMPQTPLQDRAQVMSVIYVIAYLAFGVPTIIAGLMVPIVGLGATMISLGIAIVLLCVLSTFLKFRERIEP